MIIVSYKLGFDCTILAAFLKTITEVDATKNGLLRPILRSWLRCYYLEDSNVNRCTLFLHTYFHARNVQNIPSRLFVCFAPLYVNLSFCHYILLVDRALNLASPLLSQDPFVMPNSVFLR